MVGQSEVRQGGCFSYVAIKVRNKITRVLVRAKIPGELVASPYEDA